jgi:hypothetical protein
MPGNRGGMADLLNGRAKLALILVVIALVLSVIDWAWPNAIRQALQPVFVLVSARGF